MGTLAFLMALIYVIRIRVKMYYRKSIQREGDNNIVAHMKWHLLLGSSRHKNCYNPLNLKCSRYYCHNKFFHEIHIFIMSWFSLCVCHFNLVSFSNQNIQ